MTEDPRISEIRAVLTEYVSTNDLDAQLDVRRRIRAIVDRLAPASRVFFPGDTVAEGTVLMQRGGYVSLVQHDVTVPEFGGFDPWVEVLPPSPAEWQAAVDQARAEREVQP